MKNNTITTTDKTVYECDGKRFRLTQDPYIDGFAGTRGYYTAHAKCLDDGRTYRLYWDILDDWSGEDEGDACDWDTVADCRCED